MCITFCLTTFLVHDWTIRGFCICLSPALAFCLLIMIACSHPSPLAYYTLFSASHFVLQMILPANRLSPLELSIILRSCVSVVLWKSKTYTVTVQLSGQILSTYCRFSGPSGWSSGDLMMFRCTCRSMLYNSEVRFNTSVNNRFALTCCYNYCVSLLHPNSRQNVWSCLG